MTWSKKMIKLKFLLFVATLLNGELTENAYQRYLVDRMEDSQEEQASISLIALWLASDVS